MSAVATGMAMALPAQAGELSTDLPAPGLAFRIVAMLGTTAVQEGSDMDQIESARARVERAIGLPAVLDAAYDAFEQMLTAITIQQDRGGETFAAFVMSGTAVANGRDALAAAPSLPRVSSGDLAGTAREPCGDLPPQAAADALASLSQLLSRRLTDAGDHSADAGDRVACIRAARHAAYVCSLLGGTPEP
jgi:hypothetical protein